MADEFPYLKKGKFSKGQYDGEGRIEGRKAGKNIELVDGLNASEAFEQGALE